ncbi:Glycoprotein-N-acetylgalactosamine 3-beta-galactosyltransferase 1 [Fasciola hepatica]|uniref:Glycoprotein-N-acetylgalactosamine 3-beta-galactosyltransferase 1 n=1 Tax=Fasciola hepatica TaxID=6192 RepID=A0A4E0RR47_FASHE|nr:Glycoprotein-N-acetylgalactosamine 3-beta-galactosyltransferase 1 [Fasciola hepatica]
MRVILQRIYQFRNQYSYFYKADDDTFSIIENLKHELANHNPDDPFMTGHRWHLRIPGGYFSGRAGYVLSREALKRIVEKAIFKHPKCPDTDESMEDVKMSICGSAVGVGGRILY